jgi:hypothetical protein
MESDLRAASTTVDAQSAVSWPAIAAGAAATAALTLVLIAFGAGLGLSSVSPWSGSGASASTFNYATGIYLVIVAVMSSAVGGYLAGRLRTKWTGVHVHEVYFRDTAHGFLAWAFATVVSASALTSTTTYLATGTAAGLTGAASQSRSVNPADVYVDQLFRPSPSSQPAAGAAPAAADTGGTTPPANGASSGASSGPSGATNPGVTRMEVVRLWSSDFSSDKDLTPGDKTYVAQLVAARTGMSQADAEKRVNDVTTQAKTDADNARKGAAKLSFWLTAAMLFGAFAASLAAAEGGSLRDGIWNDRVLTPRA